MTVGIAALIRGAASLNMYAVLIGIGLMEVHTPGYREVHKFDGKNVAENELLVLLVVKRNVAWAHGKNIPFTAYDVCGSYQKFTDGVGAEIFVENPLHGTPHRFRGEII